MKIIERMKAVFCWHNYVFLKPLTNSLRVLVCLRCNKKKIVGHDNEEV